MAIEIDVINEQAECTIAEALMGKIRQMYDLIAEQEGLSGGEVSLSFVDDRFT